MAEPTTRTPLEEPPLTRRIAAEGVGLFFLFICVIGSGIMAKDLSGGNDAVALLGNTLATGAMLFVLITMLGPISATAQQIASELGCSVDSVTFVVEDGRKLRREGL